MSDPPYRVEVDRKELPMSNQIPSDVLEALLRLEASRISEESHTK